MTSYSGLDTMGSCQTRGLRCCPRGPVSRVSDSRVLRKEEPPEQGVDAQQTFAGKGDRVGIGHRQVALGAERVPLLREPLPDVDLVLVLEVGGPDRSALELQDQLPDHALLGARPVGPS